jgi:hypothetical protein
MGFRRDGDKHRAWYMWIGRNRGTLIQCGLPEFVYADRMTWLRFLEHDGWDHEHGWNVEMLSPHEAGVLSDFIMREYGKEAYLGILRALNDVRARSDRAER